MASTALAALVAFSLLLPPTAGVAVAAPAALAVAFRDLPTSVRAGSALTVQVGVSSGATCDGTITYRDGVVQKLDSLGESDGRCRWNPTVPDDARRGNADIVVNAHQDSDVATVTASIDVTRQNDDIEASFHELPGTVRRADEVTLRVDVDDGASCQGMIYYDDTRTQPLAAQASTRQRCRWTFTVPADAAYGVARLGITVVLGASQTVLLSSFDVGRKAEDAEITVGLKGLPISVRRDDAFTVRAQVPDDATCSGTVSYFGVAPQALGNVDETDGECRWSIQVSSDARPGTAEIDVTANQGDSSQTVVAQVPVERGSSDVDADFKDLANEIQRGQTLEVRVSVPDNATCSGSVTYQDDDPLGLATQTEHKDRCLWELPISSTAPRGTAAVRVTVTDGSDSTTLLGNVEVLGKGEVSKASWASDLPDSLKPGEEFDLKVNVPDSASCSGSVTYTGSGQSALQSRDESGSQCKWRVTVPTETTPGTANVQISVVTDKREMKLSGTIKIEGAS
jgi:hypothetical protein